MSTVAQARRCPIVTEPLTTPCDYADAFEVDLMGDDGRTAEEIVRKGLSSMPSPLGAAVVLVHRYVLMLRLGPAASPHHVAGWRIVTAEPDVVRLTAAGPMISGALIARRSGGTARLTTQLHYRRPAARIVWAVVGPVHRRIAPYLLQRAARRPTATGSA